MPISDAIKQVLLPKGRGNDTATGFTNTFEPTNTGNILSVPDYRNHLQDLFTNRQSQDAKTLLVDLFKYDSDMSATLHAYLSVANTAVSFYVYDKDGQLDRQGQKDFETLLGALVRRHDYTTGFQINEHLREIAEKFRYSLLLRGSFAAELIFNKLLAPSRILQIDTGTLEWFEDASGNFKPQQNAENATDPIPLDIANFFYKSYRQNPNEIYTESLFVSSINTIAARQQVINDLYRIMQKTGYPRLDITVVEEVLTKNMPESAKKTQADRSAWVNARMNEIQNSVASMRPDSVFVHTDAVSSDIINQQGGSKAFSVTEIIEVLNSQNQAALKTVATFIGRGESGVNTASVEARVFQMAADSLNDPIAEVFSDMFTLALRMNGYEGYVACSFAKAELRPETELEPMKVIKQSRLMTLLSEGIISDDEFHIQVLGRMRPDSAPELSGTRFQANNGEEAAAVDVSQVSPNDDSLGRSISPEGGSAARSDNVDSGEEA